MAGVAPAPYRFQFFDNSGNPLNGGKVDVYLAGTTTRTNTWSDRAQTTLNANPIVLDSAGRASIVLDTSKTYKFVVKTSANVTLYTDDNIVGAAGLSTMASALADIEAARVAAIADIEVAAEPFVDDAEAASVIATAAALRAEQARDAAAVAGNLYDSTAIGLAQTSGTGDTDRFFSVPQEDSETALILYRNDAGVATEITRYAALDSTTENASDLAEDETNVLAIDATTDDTDHAVVVRDVSTPGNNYEGSLYGFLASTVFPSARMIVDEDGTLKWQAHQLFYQAKDFTNANWAKTTTTVTALAAASDGEIPYQLAATSTTSRVQENLTVFADQWYTVEFIAEKGTSDWCYINVNTSGTNPRSWFNLNTGAKGTVGAGVTSEISALDKDGSTLPAGRYRCTVRFKAGGTTLNAAFGQSDADNSTNVTNGRTIKLYRGHHHAGVKDLEFLDSPSGPVRGIPYDWSKGVRAMLVEPMTTNYRSQWADDLTNAVWTATSATTALNATGPHDEPCTTVTFTGNNGTILQTTATAATSHTVTAWIKRKTGSGTIYLQCNGTTQAVTINSTSYTRVKMTWSGASAVAVFGIKGATSGDEVYVSMLKCANQAFATSDIPTYSGTPYSRSADVPTIALTRFPSGAQMTAFFDFDTQDDLTGTMGPSFVGASDFAAISALGSSQYLRADYSVSSTATNFVLGDFAPGDRVEGTLRIDTNNHAGTVNGIGACYDIRQGAPSLTSLNFGGGSAGPMWVRRIVVVKRSLADDSLERWHYSGDDRDERYLDDVIVARHGETADVTVQREPAVGTFWDREDSAGGYVLWLERNVTPNPSHAELPYRLRGRSWEIDKVALAAGEPCLSLGTKQTLVQPTNWATGLGHVQSPNIFKQTVGPERGRVWIIYAQLDTADGLLTPDHRRIYAAYSDDNMTTLSTPTVIYDRGAGTATVPDPIGNVVEFPADSDYPGRLVVGFDSDTSPNIGVLYRDPGGSWTLGGTAIISGGAEPALALRPNDDLLISIRTETPNQRYEAVLTNGGTTFGTPALIASGTYTNVAMSLSQMDPRGENGRLGKMLLVGCRASSPFARSGFTVEEFVGQPITPSGTQFRPLGSVRFAGYSASRALNDGLLLVAHEDSAGNSFNDRCSIRLMLLRP